MNNDYARMSKFILENGACFGCHHTFNKKKLKYVPYRKHKRPFCPECRKLIRVKK